MSNGVTQATGTTPRPQARTTASVATGHLGGMCTGLEGWERLQQGQTREDTAPCVSQRCTWCREQSIPERETFQLPAPQEVGAHRGPGAERDPLDGGSAGHVPPAVSPVCHPDPAEPSTDGKIHEPRRSLRASFQKTGYRARMLQTGPPRSPLQLQWPTVLDLNPESATNTRFLGELLHLPGPQFPHL